MEIVGLAEKPEIKLFVDMWGPDHPSRASIDSIPFHSTALHSIDPFHCCNAFHRSIGVDGCSGWMIRTPNVHEKFDFGFVGQSDNFHFSKVAHFFLFARRVRKWPQQNVVPQKSYFLKNIFKQRF